MYYLKILFCILLLYISSCSSNIQNNGLTEIRFNKININVGKTTKKDLFSEYGPPFFESVFNKNVIYYVSHNTKYKVLDEFKTNKLFVYEITFDEKNIVSRYKKYSKKNAYKVSVSNKESTDENNTTFILKEILNNMRRKNIQN